MQRGMAVVVVLFSTFAAAVAIKGSFIGADGFNSKMDAIFKGEQARNAEGARNFREAGRHHDVMLYWRTPSSCHW